MLLLIGKGIAAAVVVAGNRGGAKTSGTRTKNVVAGKIKFVFKSICY